MAESHVSSLLSVLTRDRLVELARTAGVSISVHARKERQIETLLDATSDATGDATGDGDGLALETVVAALRLRARHDHGHDAAG